MDHGESMDGPAKNRNFGGAKMVSTSKNFFSLSLVTPLSKLDRLYREYYRGKYHCTVDLLFDWFGLVCYANKNKNCQLSYS